MDEPRTPVLSKDRTPQTGTWLLDSSTVFESTPQKRRLPPTRQASTRSTASSVVRGDMHVPPDNASGTWQMSLIVLIKVVFP